MSANQHAPELWAVDELVAGRLERCRPLRATGSSGIHPLHADPFGDPDAPDEARSSIQRGSRCSSGRVVRVRPAARSSSAPIPWRPRVARDDSLSGRLHLTSASLPVYDRPSALLHRSSSR